MKISAVKRIIAWIIVTMFIGSFAHAEEIEKKETDYIWMKVIASQLNGRAYPSKRSAKEAFWDYGDTVKATGKWSDNHEWVEVVGGENGTAWCKAVYLTERMDEFYASNEGRRAVKIRSKPIDGKVRGYLRGGKTIKITQVVLGWGKCKKGWIDLSYLCEIEE